MALLDAKFVPLALKLLNKYGASASIRLRDSDYTFDASTGMRQQVADKTLPVKAVPPSIAKDLIRDGSNETSAVSYISPLEISQDVTNCDTLIMPDGKEYKVAKFTNIYSGDLVALIRLDLE